MQHKLQPQTWGGGQEKINTHPLNLEFLLRNSKGVLKCDFNK